MPSSARVVGLLNLALAGAIGCQQTTPHEIVPPPPAPAFHIEPRRPNLPAGGAVQFHAVSDGGAAVAVKWRVVDSHTGRISSDGLFTADSCADGSIAAIISQLTADTTRSDTALASVNHAAPGIMAMYGLNSVPFVLPRVALDSVAGEVTVQAQLTFNLQACFGLAGLRLEIVSGAVVTPLDSLRIPPNTWGPEFPSFLWRTTAFPNGAYGVRVAARFGTALWAASDFHTNTIPMFVNNP